MSSNVSMALRRIFHSKATVRSFCSHSEFLEVSVNKENGVATISMKRPPVNSINMELLSEVSDTLTNLEKIKCRGMVLTSFSDKVFSAGLDINELYKTNRGRCTQLFSTLQKTSIQLYTTSFPTVAVITGHSPAGGCAISLCCEYRIMVENFTIGLNEVQLGFPVPVWGSNIMLNTIGPRNTELALNEGKLFKTNDALKVGLIDEIATNRTDALQKANEFLKRFEMIPSIGRIYSKNSVRGALIEDVRKNGQKYTEDFVSYLLLPEVQQQIEFYFNKLKNRKQKSA